MILAPFPKYAFLDNNGRPLVGGLLFTYTAGTTAKLATYTDTTGVSQNTNPIVLDYRGEASVYLDPSLTYKFVLAPPGDTDPPTRPIWTIDNIPGLGATGNDIGRALWPITPAELAANFTAAQLTYSGPQGYIPRYGIVANNLASASTNSAIAIKLFNPLVNGPSGSFKWYNLTGSDIYYFNDFIQVRDGCHWDLDDSQLSFTRTYTASDDFKSFISAIRDFSITNGSIYFRLIGAPALKNIGMFQLGSRIGYAFGQYTGGIYDFDDLIAHGLPPMGNIKLTKLRLDCDNPGYSTIWAWGGLENVEIDEIVATGTNTTIYLLYYEFGYSSTNGFALPFDEFWTSSHANNFRVTNIKARNFTNVAGEGDVIHIAGAYSATIENVDGQNVNHVVTIRPGEALFYRMWNYNSPGGGKRATNLKNITGRNYTGNLVNMIGAEAATGYLNPVISALTVPQQAAATTNLMQYSLDGFAASGGGFGVVASGKCEIANGGTQGCVSGIRIVGTCPEFNIHDCDILDSTAEGIRANEPSTVTPTTFKKQGRITGCKVAGSVGAGISFNWTQGVHVEANQLGYNATEKFDAAAEATQTNGVLCAANADSVTVKDNHVTTSGGAVAYQKTSGPGGCTFVSGFNTKTLGGLWLAGGLTVQNNVTFAAPTNIDCANGMTVNLNVNAGGAFTINAPTNIQVGLLTIFVQNTSGGAMGAITWNAIFKLAGAFTNPANNQQRGITFQYDGTSLHEVSRNAADVPT